MTDERVIKALEQCGNIIVSSCKDCPFHKKHNANCVRELTKDALDLIKRQQAEIEALINGQETLQKMCAEAYKYFAERLEDISSERLVFEGYGENRVVNVVEYGDIVNLVKELTEGK